LKWIGIKTALASNATDFYRLISRKKFNLDKLLDHIYLTCELGYAKNGKEFYRKIMNDTWVLSTQATMIGDNIKADILASQDAWLQAIHILRNDDSHKKDQFSKHLSTSNLWDNEQWFQTVSDLSQALQIIKDRK
jgi:FMN phosphatase YigB (HAD superfamily)